MYPAYINTYVPHIRDHLWLTVRLGNAYNVTALPQTLFGSLFAGLKVRQIKVIENVMLRCPLLATSSPITAPLALNVFFLGRPFIGRDTYRKNGFVARACRGRLSEKQDETV